jgi:DNA gyrase/topoisomerase IV subunit B
VFEVILFAFPCIVVQIRTGTLLLLFFTRSIEREEFVIAAKPPLLALSNNRTKCIATVKDNAAIRITANELKCQFSGFGGLGVACWPSVPKFAG